MRKRILEENYGSEWQRAVKVPAAWLEKAITSIRTLEAFYGKVTRIMHIGGAIAVAFRRGAEVVLPCPFGTSMAYREALEKALHATRSS